MANAGSTSSLLALAAAATSTAPACPYSTLFFKCRRQWRRAMMTCRAASNDEGLLWLPRRDVLTGLTGVATGLTSYPGLASAALPMLEDQCRRGDKVSDALVKCTDRGAPCPPPANSKIVDFNLDEEAKLRIRKPVHLLTEEEQSIYRAAVKKMKALPAEHPPNFDQQANIHEAYCDGHYRYDPTEKNRPFDVHSSWIFAPWHRMYIFFYERALRALLKQDKDLAKHADDFALPYWNWDAPDGMALPAIFKDASSNNSLYDANRDSKHLDALIDLDFASTRSEPIPFNKVDITTTEAYKEAVKRNLCTIYQQQVRMAKGARCFHGDKLCSQTSFVRNEINDRSRRRLDPRTKLTKVRGSTSGSLESMAHGSVHIWTGRPNDPNLKDCPTGHDGEPHCSNDMGFLGSASRDPVFYSHHANVDRMWYLWNRLGGKDFEDAEWKDASFVFYDAGGSIDNPQLVRIKVGDVLDTTKLGYAYADDYKERQGKPNEYYKDEDVAKWKETLPWINSKPTRLTSTSAPPTTAEDPESFIPLELGVNQVLVLPVALPPKVDGKLRVLEIEGIEYDPSKGAKIDVAINVPTELASMIGTQHSEYAGSFARVPTSSSSPEKKRGGDGKELPLPPIEAQVGKVSLLLDDVLADVAAESDASVNVVLVRRTTPRNKPEGEGEGQITITLPPIIRNENFC